MTYDDYAEPQLSYGQTVDPNSIEALDLTVRTYNLLKREGINTLQGIAACTESQLLDLRNFGQQSVDEVKLKLSEHGLRLRPAVGEAFTDVIDIEHVTVYRWGNVTVTLNGDGSAVVSQREFTEDELGALCRICELIVTTINENVEGES